MLNTFKCYLKPTYTSNISFILSYLVTAIATDSTCMLTLCALEIHILLIIIIIIIIIIMWVI